MYGFKLTELAINETYHALTFLFNLDTGNLIRVVRVYGKENARDLSPPDHIIFLGYIYRTCASVRVPTTDIHWRQLASW